MTFGCSLKSSVIANSCSFSHTSVHSYSPAVSEIDFGPSTPVSYMSGGSEEASHEIVSKSEGFRSEKIRLH